MENKTQNSTVTIAKAGLLLALMVVVQLISLLFPMKSVPIAGQLFTGTLVNLVLILGAGSVGFVGTAAAAVLSPVLAFLFGQMKFPQMIPVVALGNLIIVAITWLFFKNWDDEKKAFRLKNITGILLGSALKMLFLWGATAWLMVPVFFAGNQKMAKMLTLMFSWPQLVTALLGGILALLILPAVRKHQSKKASA